METIAQPVTTLFISTSANRNIVVAPDLCVNVQVTSTIMVRYAFRTISHVRKTLPFYTLAYTSLLIAHG